MDYEEKIVELMTEKFLKRIMNEPKIIALMELEMRNRIRTLVCENIKENPQEYEELAVLLRNNPKEMNRGVH